MREEVVAHLVQVRPAQAAQEEAEPAVQHQPRQVPMQQLILEAAEVEQDSHLKQQVELEVQV
jgi:hypothetical protein